MRKSLLSLFFILFSLFLTGQRLHTPTEVQQFMEKSSINFSMDTLVETLPSVDLPLVENGNFLVITDLGYQLEKREFTLSSSAKKYIAKAEKFERKNKITKSIKFLNRAHDLHPENMRVMKYLGSLYLENNQIEMAIPLFEKVIEINEIDFEAHSLLAVSYHKSGQKEKALDHISIAHLLNRNNQKIIEILKVVYLDNELLYIDKSFDPEYEIEVLDNKNIIVKANEAPWIAYAACKSLWENEPKYKKEMMNYANIDIKQLQQKECLLNALLSYEEMESGKNAYPLLGYLGTSLENKMVEDFILYEIESRKNPMMMSLLPKERLQGVMKYLRTIRVGQKASVR